VAALEVDGGLPEPGLGGEHRQRVRKHRARRLYLERKDQAKKKTKAKGRATRARAPKQAGSGSFFVKKTSVWIGRDSPGLQKEHSKEKERQGPLAASRPSKLWASSSQVRLRSSSSTPRQMECRTMAAQVTGAPARSAASASFSHCSRSITTWDRTVEKDYKKKQNKKTKRGG
jgi:hypothetical protein